jgi:hypothetical protein
MNYIGRVTKSEVSSRTDQRVDAAPSRAVPGDNHLQTKGLCRRFDDRRHCGSGCVLDRFPCGSAYGAEPLTCCWEAVYSLGR